ncbi:MAG: prephenate dehydratase [Chloroflexi bacterium]|nr:prephenate dehydratase [Chloroflexota bacterium]
MTPRLGVGYQGEPGAYSEEACLSLFGSEIQPVPCDSFDAVFEGVEAGRLDYGVVPVENSLAGSIHRNYDLLLQHALHIIAEHNLRVSHCLIAHPGATLETIERVFSHPQALAQCEQSLSALSDVEIHATYDTAGSVKMVKESGDPHAAAIASARAAEIYGMQVLVHEFEDEKANFTRFVAISRDPVVPAEEIEAKTSIAFAGINRPGLLWRCLSAFALRDIDLSKIESRPLKGVPWQYVFYVDFAGGPHQEPCRRALDHLREMTTFVRVFGSYPRASNAPLDSD